MVLFRRAGARSPPTAQACRPVVGRKPPVFRTDDPSRTPERGATPAYVIADNKLSENAGWDQEILATEFQFLSGLNLEFDVTVGAGAEVMGTGPPSPRLRPWPTFSRLRPTEGRRAASL